MRKVSKRAWMGVKLFVDTVREEFERRGIPLSEYTPFDPKAPGSTFSFQGEAMTDVGHMTIWLYDWLHTCFALPEIASKSVNCNPYSGKFNFHPEREAFGDEQYTREFVNMIFLALDKVNVRPWEVTHKRITEGELSHRPLEEWIKDQKMGSLYVIDGFDKAATAHKIIEESCTQSSEAVRDFSTRSLATKTDVEVMMALRQWEEVKSSSSFYSESSITAPPAPGT